MKKADKIAKLILLVGLKMLSQLYGEGAALSDEFHFKGITCFFINEDSENKEKLTKK